MNYCCFLHHYQYRYPCHYSLHCWVICCCYFIHFHQSFVMKMILTSSWNASFGGENETQSFHGDANSLRSSSCLTENYYSDTAAQWFRQVSCFTNQTPGFKEGEVLEESNDQQRNLEIIATSSTGFESDSEKHYNQLDFLQFKEYVLPLRLHPHHLNIARKLQSSHLQRKFKKKYYCSHHLWLLFISMMMFQQLEEVSKLQEQAFLTHLLMLVQL